jgi:hypothetical protein
MATDIRHQQAELRKLYHRYSQTLELASLALL